MGLLTVREQRDRLLAALEAVTPKAGGDTFSNDPLWVRHRALIAECRAADRLRPDGYDAGWADAVRLYAVWKDGQQLVGVMREPLAEVLAEGPPPDIKKATLG